MADRTPASHGPEIDLDGGPGSWLDELATPEHVARARALVTEGEAIRAQLARWVSASTAAIEDFENTVAGKGLSPRTLESFAQLSGAAAISDLAADMGVILDAIHNTR